MNPQNAREPLHNGLNQDEPLSPEERAEIWRGAVMPYASAPAMDRQAIALDRWDDLTPAERETELLASMERLHDEAEAEVNRQAPPPSPRGKAANSKRPPFDWRNTAISARALMAKVFPEIVYVVPGVLPEGLTLLVGRPKLGKSWWALDLCIAVAGTSHVMASIEPGARGSVLYAALEDNQRRLKRRMKKLLGPGDPPERLTLCTEWPRTDQGGIEALGAWCDAHPDAKLVVVDTLQAVRPITRENGYAQDYLAVAALQKFAGERGISVLVLHHDRKAEAEDAFDTVSGTLGLTGAADAILILKRDYAAGMCVLHGKGRDIEEFEKAMLFDKSTCVWRMTGDADEQRLSKERRSIIAALGTIAKEEPAAPKEIAAAAKMKVENVKVLLGKMVEDGAVEKEGTGKYRLPKHPDLASD